MSFVEVKPAEKSTYCGISVSKHCLRVSRELRELLQASTVHIHRDEDMLAIAIAPGGPHYIKKDGRIPMAHEHIKMPRGRYHFHRKDKKLGLVCVMPM